MPVSTHSKNHLDYKNTATHHNFKPSQHHFNKKNKGGHHVLRDMGIVIVVAFILIMFGLMA